MITIKADFTCDNNYAFYTGTASKVKTKIKQFTNTSASQIFDGEHISFQANKTDFLYVIAWSDDVIIQGLIGSFDGGVQIHTGHPDWVVLPTDINKGNQQFPSKTEINNVMNTAYPVDWKIPYVGPSNQNTSQIYGPSKNPVKGIPLDANWVWYDSGLDTSPGSTTGPNPPFKGFNHNEFLIFRIPIKTLVKENCEYKGCNKQTDKQNLVLKDKALVKSNVIVGKGLNPKCGKPYDSNECPAIKLPKNIAPCFYLHWGDGPQDIIETHDTEVVYLTVCNNYANLDFKGIRITKILITPSSGQQSDGEPEMQIIPDAFIHFDCLEGCTCTTRELALLTRGIKPGNYQLNVKYCIDKIEFSTNITSRNIFDIEVFKS